MKMLNPSLDYYLFDISSLYLYSSLYVLLFHLFHFKPALVIAQSQSQAPSHLEMGLQFLAKGQINEALHQFHSAIEENPNDFMPHYRRATAYLALGKGKAALDDLDTVLRLRPDFQAARTQRANILTKYGRFQDALDEYDTIKGIKESEEVLMKIETLTKLKANAIEAEELIEHDEAYAEALVLLDDLVDACPWSTEFRRLRSDALIKIGELSKAVFDLKQLTKLINDNTQGFLKLSMLYYQMAEDEQSLSEIRECLKLDPDHKECFSHYKKVKKLNKQLTDAQEMLNENNYEECIRKIDLALKTEPTVVAFQTKLAPKKCKCLSKSKQSKAAIKFCSDALESLPDDEDLLVDRAEAYLVEEEFEKAIKDYETAIEHNEESKRLKEGLQRAKKLLKQSKKRDYYKILGVKRSATKQEINKAYRKLAQQWHPDRYDGEDKEAAEKKFMDIAAAKEVLSDPEKREKFDNGEDPLDPEEQQRGHDPFGGGGFPGGFPFNFQGGNFQFKFRY